MPREYTKVKHLESLVFEMKDRGKTNAQIGEALGLTKAQIKGLVKRYNRRAGTDKQDEYNEPPFYEPTGIRTQGEINEELQRLTGEMESLECELSELTRMWNRIDSNKKIME